jgi:predicted DNA-binding ribbon-helix-helix protein
METHICTSTTLLEKAMKEENILRNSEGAIVGQIGKSDIKHHHLSNITSAIKIAITEHTKVEREILNYTSDSAFVAGLKMFLADIESNSPMIIYNHDGTIKFKTF